MAGTRGDTTTGEPVERFRATTGHVTGIFGLLIAAATLGYVVLRVHSVTGLRLAFAMAVFATLVWVSQLRPRATAYPETLVLRNMFRDTFVPLRLIEEVAVRQMLYVWVGDRRYGCVGIGRSVRSLVGHKRPSARVLGFGKMVDEAEKIDIPHPEHTAMPYATFVEIRIDDLAKFARKQPVTEPAATVRTRWAWPEIVVLAVSCVGFVVTLGL